MPLYEYQCQDCDNRFERIERASAIHDGVCPACGGSARRLIGAPALKFKGSGWYVNDYGKGNGNRPADDSTHGTDASPTEKKAESTETPSSAKKKSSDTSTSSKVA